MGYLQRTRPDADAFMRIEPASPLERLALCPCSQDQVDRLFVAWPRLVERNIHRQVLLGHPAHKPGDESTSCQEIQHRELLGQPDWIVQRCHVAVDAYTHVFRSL